MKTHFKWLDRKLVMSLKPGTLFWNNPFVPEEYMNAQLVIYSLDYIFHFLHENWWQIFKKIFNVWEGLKNTIWKEKAVDGWSKSSTSSAEGTALQAQDGTSQMSSLLQEWSHHITQGKKVYDTYKCENFVHNCAFPEHYSNNKTQKKHLNCTFVKVWKTHVFSQGNTLKILIKPQWNLYSYSLLSSFHNP